MTNRNAHSHPAPLRAWIEAMRLRTLPVSVAGVIMATGYAVAYDTFHPVPALLCLIFAVLAQIASNFANEYYDYRDGLDKAGRVGPRRGVTEGDIPPGAMKTAVFVTLGLACMTGCMLILFGGWWLIAVGALIVAGALAYSAGPVPLSRCGLGEVAVMIFFGIIPVNLTFWLQSGVWNLWVAGASLSVGLMGANVLIVNNYRDRDDDRAVGKRTLAVMLGRPAMAAMYMTDGLLAVAFMLPTWLSLPRLSLIVPGVYLLCHAVIFGLICSRRGAALNPCLGMTAVLMLTYSLGLLVCCALS